MSTNRSTNQNNSAPKMSANETTTTTATTTTSSSSSSSNGDFLNSSQTEKSWLNSSLNEKSYLNSSWNLPPELRYTALTDLVSKIVEDDLLASGNASTLNLPKLDALRIVNHDSNPTKAKSSNLSSHKVNSQESQLKTSQPGYDQTSKTTLPVNKVPLFSNQHHQNVPKNAIDSQQVIFPPQPTQNVGFEETNKKDFLPYGVGPPQQQIPMDRPSFLSFIPTQPSQLPVQAPNDMKLAYPHSYSHHLATLTPDQQNYLLQQQKELFMRLTMINNTNPNENMIHSPMSHHPPPPPPPPHIYYQQQPTAMVSQHSGGPMMSSSNLNTSNLARTFSSTSSPSPSSSKSSSESSGPSLVHPHHQKVLMQENFKQSPTFIPYHMQTPEIHYNPMYNHPNEEMIISSLIDPETLLKMNPNNEKLKMLLSKQPNYRQHRRTGPANELHIRLEECLYQLKCLESERKKIENELFHIGLSRSKFSSAPSSAQGSTHSPSTQFRLPPNPSRVDKLIAECWREHAKVSLVVSRMDALKTTAFMANIQTTGQLWLESIANVQARRKDELVKSAHKARINGATGATHQMRFYDEKDVIVLAASINLLSQMLVKMRTSLWSACQIACLIESRNHQTLANSTQQSDGFFDSLPKTKDFWQSYFTIKTDLVEINN